MSLKIKMAARKALFTQENPTLWEVGETVFVRTVTYHMVGRIIAVINDNFQNWIVLDEATWVADSGRFTPAMDEGKLAEYEPVQCPVRINTAAITDVFYWPHALPKGTK